MTTDALRSISLPVATATVIVKNRLVTVNSSGEAEQVNATADNPVGVARKGSTDSENLAIGIALLDGAILEIEAGATLTAGTLVTMRSDARIGPTASGQKRIGVALDAGSEGDVVRVCTTTGPASS